MELNEQLEPHQKIIRDLDNIGFHYSDQQVTESKEVMKKHGAPSIHLANYIFYRGS